MHLRRSDRVEERLPGALRVAVGGVAGDEPLVAPPHHDPAPVDLGPGGEPGQLVVHRLRDAASGQRDLRLVPGRLRVGQPRQQLTGHGGRERRGVGLDLHPRSGHARAFRFIRFTVAA